MTIEYCFLKETDICFARYIGLTTTLDLQQNYERYVADPYYRPGRTELIDLSRSCFDEITFTSLTPLASVVNEINLQAGAHTDTFIFAPSNIAHGMTRMYASITSEMKGLTIHQARDEATLLNMMELPHPNIQSLLHSQTIVAAAHGSGSLIGEYRRDLTG